MDRIRLKYFVYMMVLLLFIFQPFLQQFSIIFKYYDEIFSILCCIYIFINIPYLFFSNNYLKAIIFPFLAFLLITIIGTITYAQQPIVAISMDLILNIKMFVALVASFVFFKKISFDINVSNISKYILYIIIVILFSLSIIDFIFGVFPSFDQFWMFHSVQLFFSHETYYVSSVVILLSLVLLFKKKSNIIILMCILMNLMSLKIKGVCFAIFISFFLFLPRKKIQKFRLLIVAGIVCAMLVVGYSQIYFYFFSNSITARGMLLKYSLINANDNVFGTGFASFASYPSGLYYSSLYYKYNIYNVWGLQEGNPLFVSDSFWPMILGQSGYIGLTFFGIYIIGLCKKCLFLNKNRMVAIALIIYLLIASVAESAFVSLYSVPFGIIIGTTFANNCENETI